MAIGQSVLTNFHFLNSLCKTKSPRKHKKLLRKATSDELFTIIECSFNILKNRFKLTSRQRNKLIPHINIIRKIGRARTHRGIKTILQKGNGISILPALLTPILLEAFKLINNGQ